MGGHLITRSEVKDGMPSYLVPRIMEGHRRYARHTPQVYGLIEYGRDELLLGDLIEGERRLLLIFPLHRVASLRRRRTYSSVISARPRYSSAALAILLLSFPIDR